MTTETLLVGAAAGAVGGVLPALVLWWIAPWLGERRERRGAAVAGVK